MDPLKGTLTDPFKGTLKPPQNGAEELLPCNAQPPVLEELSETPSITFKV